MPSVNIPGVGIVNFPDGMPPDQLRSAVMRMHAAPSMAAEKANISDTQDEGFGDAMMMNPDQIEGMKKWAPVVGGMVAGPAAEAAGPVGSAAMRVAGSPAGAAAIGGALDYAHTGSLATAAKVALFNGLLAKVAPGVAGMLPRSLMARMTHGLAQAAVEEMPAAAAAVAPTVEAAAPAAFRGIPSLMKIAAPVAEDAAAAENARRAVAGAGGVTAGLGATGGGAAGYTAGLAASAKAAAPVAEAAAPVAEGAAETLLQTRLRASVMLKQNPAALAEEIASKVVSLKQGAGKGLSAAQIGTSLQDIYGLPPAAAKNMVTMIFQTHGFK